MDVGCSTGLAVEPFVVKYGQSNNFLLVDNAPAMVEACEKRFQADVNVTVRQGNIWEYLPFEQKSTWSSPSCPCSSCRRPTGPGCSSRFTTA